MHGVARNLHYIQQGRGRLRLLALSSNYRRDHRGAALCRHADAVAGCAAAGCWQPACQWRCGPALGAAGLSAEVFVLW